MQLTWFANKCAIPTAIRGGGGAAEGDGESGIEATRQFARVFACYGLRAAAVMLLLQPVLAAAILPLFVDLRSVPGQAALLMAALPTAASAFVLAKQFGVQVEQNTAAVLLSTGFSVVTVSALLVWLRVT